jgi:hypothetical protein
MDDLKTLEEIWAEADRKPVKVSCHDSKFGYITLVGINHHKAFDSNCFHYPANERIWKLHKEKKTVEHWPAIMKLCEKFHITNNLYRNIQDANKHEMGLCIRLATELPPIMLEVEE